MRHARPDTLDQLEPLLQQIRATPGLTEKTRGTFYLKSRAFLHFHEDPTGFYIDVRLAGAKFDRLKVDAPAEQNALMEKIRTALPS